MYLPVLVILLVTYEGTLALERNAACTTPNAEKATCQPATGCDVIRKAVVTGSSSAIDFAQKSQCGFDTEPLVCCGSSGSFLTDSTTLPSTFNIDDLFTTTPRPKVEALKEYDTSLLPDRSICGLVREPDIFNRIYGGEYTMLDEFPWAAALEYVKYSTKENVGVKCGGSVINTKFVITAAHCCLHREFELKTVRLGEWNTTSDPDCLYPDSPNPECADPVQRFAIKEQIVHPFYSAQETTNDIALLLLDREITYTDYIRPICLPPTNLPTPEIFTKLTVTGWGLTENSTEEPSEIKLKVDVPFRSNNDCIEKLNKRVSANQVCAGGMQGKDACQGDSGGPLMRVYVDQVAQRSNWFLEGVVSFGQNCGRSGYPAIYTRLSRFLNWIVNTIEGE